MTSDSSYFKNFSLVSSAKIIGAILQALFYLIFASILEPELYGQMGYLISLAGVFSIIARFGSPHTVVVYIGKKNFDVVNQTNILVLITSAIASLILLFINPFSALLCFGISLFIMNQQNILGLKKYNSFFWITVFKSILIICLPLLFYFIFDIPGILLGIAISNFLLGLNFLKSLRKNLHNFHDLKSHYKIIIHNFGVDSSASLTQWIDKLLIVPLFGFVFVGLYQFNLQILFAFSLLPFSLHSFLLSEESSGKSNNIIINVTLLFSIIFVLSVIFSSDFFITSFFPNYSEGIDSLKILIISLIPISITSIFSAKLQAQESVKVGFSAVIRIGSLLLFIAVFGDLFGLIGLSLAVLISTILESVFLFALYLNSKNNKMFE